MTTLWTTPLRGHCFCNACSYTLDPTREIPAAKLDAFIKEFKNNFISFWDHCTDCRRATTSLATAYFIIPLEYLVWSEGTEQHLKTYVSSNGDVERKFCRQCGTSFTYFRHSRPGGGIDITIGSLADEDLQKLEELGMTPTKLHVFWETGGIRWYQKEWLHGGKEYEPSLWLDGHVADEHAVQIDVDAELAKLK
ncbi:Mss4-like protein [Sphaerosporella brunnea]|uniref:Mss4-like protein n=1 Tax=Sphaerosporella brunnea TaxID=1250544 RepID=A0A5J5EXZ4_9PEZI|nr:Mss4-like protein [Sphaerosporella brunnea]